MEQITKEEFLKIVADHMKQNWPDTKKHYDDQQERMEKINQLLESNSYVIETVIKAHLLIENHFNDL